MASKMKYMLTVFFILGFQLQLPVTTLPASFKSGRNGLLELGPVLIGQVGRSGNILSSDYEKQLSKPRTNLASGVTDNGVTDGEYSQINLQYIQHDDKPSLIESISPRTGSFNKNMNQTRWEKRLDINGGEDQLNGLEMGLRKDQIDSPKSVINRIKDDLMRGELERTHDRPANLSANLKTRGNIFTTNNGTLTVNGHKVDKDGSDYINNTLAIKSQQTLDKQIVTDRTHLQADNTSGGPLNSRVVRGVFWSPEFVTKCPSGIRDGTLKGKWRDLVERHTVIAMEPGCGSMQNRLITFNDSTKACVRYRLNSDQMQGEIYSYYLGKLLNINYTPDTIMHTVDNTQQWQDVRKGIISSKWSDNKPIIVTKWIESLEPVYMPDELKDIKRNLHQENKHLGVMSPGLVCDLVQWSDLIVFDYISANLDRVVNNLFNLKWNPKMLEKPIHNLEKIRSSGQYIFIDNESGLFHGYRLLDAYQSYHEKLLNSVCVFRESTVDALERLYAAGNAGDKLQHMYETNEKHHGLLPRMSNKNKQILQSRIQDVVKHIQRCKHNTGTTKS